MLVAVYQAATVALVRLDIDIILERPIARYNRGLRHLYYALLDPATACSEALKNNTPSRLVHKLQPQ